MLVVYGASKMALASDSNDIIQWKLVEPSGPWANTGTGGTLSLIGASTNYYGFNSINTTPYAPSPDQSYVLAAGAGNYPSSSYENHLVTSTPIGTAGTTIGEIGTNICFSTYIRMSNYTGGSGGTSEYGVIACKCGDPSNTLALGWQTVLNPPDNGEWYTGASFGGTSQYFGSEPGYELPIGSWSHIGWTYDGTTLLRYKDGNLCGTYLPSPSGAISYGTHGPYNVAGGMNNGGNNIEGYLSDMRIASTVRSINWFRAMAVASLSISSSSESIIVGGSTSLVVTATYLDSHTDHATNDVTWSTSNSSVATVSSSGLVTGIGAGTATITATWGSNASGPIQVTSSVTVSLGVVSIRISPTITSMEVGQSIQLQAIGTYADGSTINLTTEATWVSSNPLALSVSSTGIITALTAQYADVVITASI